MWRPRLCFCSSAGTPAPFAYRCRNCDDEFTISPLKDFWSPHGWWFDGGWKLLRCPRCHRWARATVIRKSAMSAPDGDETMPSP